jgi:hypothetical protein
LAANGAVAAIARSPNGSRIVVWRADGSRVTIGYPSQRALHGLFRRSNVYQPEFPAISFRYLALAPDGTPFATIANGFSGAYTGEERRIFRWTGLRWVLIPTDHTIGLDADVAAAELPDLRIAVTGEYSSEVTDVDLVHSVPTYHADEAYVLHGTSATKLGLGRVEAMAGRYLCGYLRIVDWQAHHGLIPEERPTALRWHDGRTDRLGSGIAFGLNRDGVAVGDDRSSVQDVAHSALPMRWDAQNGRPLIHRYGSAYAIAPDGTIVGALRHGGGFVVRDGRFTLLDQAVAGVHVVGAYAINARGRILVTIGRADAPQPAYLDPAS